MQENKIQGKQRDKPFLPFGQERLEEESKTSLRVPFETAFTPKRKKKLLNMLVRKYKEQKMYKKSRDAV